MSEKVQSVALNSANVRYNNENNESKIYNIEANVNIQGTSVTSFDGGVVRQNDIVLCSFSQYGENRLNVNFQNITDDSEMCEIINAVNAFIDDVIELVAINTINV